MHHFRIIRLKKNTKVTVIGDIHEHVDQFMEMVDRVKPTPDNILVSVGDIYDKGNGDEPANRIINKLRELNLSGSAYMVQGNHESKRFKTVKNKCDNLKWAESQPRVITFRFANQTKLTVLHAGVTPKHTAHDLNHNIEVMYVRCLDENDDYIPLTYKLINGRKKLRPVRDGGVPWHKRYNGRFGYIISGHDSQEDGRIKFYKYSANIDTRCYDTGILSGIVYSEKGRLDIIRVKGIGLRKAMSKAG